MVAPCRERTFIPVGCENADSIYEILFRQAGVGLFQTTPAGRFVRANRRLAEMYGWPTAEAMIAEIRDIGSQLYADAQFRARLVGDLERNDKARFVTSIRRRDGRMIWVDEAVFVLRGTDGLPEYYLGSATDVTELVAMQQRLLAAEGFAENATEGVYRCDPEGRIVAANSAFVRLLGYADLRELLADVGEQGAVVHYVDAGRPRQFRREIAVTGRLTDFESEVTRHNGDRIWISENARVIAEESGRVLWYEGTVRDITRQKRTEARLRQAWAEAERASEAKTRFLAAASHDLRQPFQAMRLLLHALSNRQTDPQSRALAHHLDQTMIAGETLLNALLDISTLEAGMIRPQIVEFPIETVLSRLAGEFAPQAAAGGQRLRVVGSREMVQSDPVLLDRILRNLLQNAIRHCPQANILVGCRREAGHLRVEVWDSGPGIPREKLEEIFREVSHLANEERDDSRLHGLGLAIVRGLARLLGHELAIRSDLGRGSVFSVRLPTMGPALSASDEDRGDELASHQVLAGRPQTVLVIEDESAQRMSLALLLEDWGYQVKSATDLVTAIAQIGEGAAPAFVVSDLRLPGGANGVEAVREIAQRLGRAVPCIILTGDTDPARLREARQSGCILLHKPVSMGSLRHAVASLGRNRNGSAGSSSAR